MTEMIFTYAGIRLPDGRHEVHMYIRVEEPTYDLPLRSERKAAEDALTILKDLVKVNHTDDPDRLLREGPVPEGAVRICEFGFKVSWDRRTNSPVYRKGGYARFEWDAKWQPVAALMMEQRDYMMSVVNKRLRENRREHLAKMEKFVEERT